MTYLTGKDVYEKYRNLRTTFFREHKRVSSAPTGRPGDPPEAAQGYQSKWRHYQNMLFLTKVYKSGKTDLDGNNNNGNHNLQLHNEDSTSTDHLPPSTHGLNNGHDNIEIVTMENGQQKILVSASINNRPQPMDTADNDTSIVQNLSSNPTSTTSIVNHAHLSSHVNGENDLYLINTSDGGVINGGSTILTANGAGLCAST